MKTQLLQGVQEHQCPCPLKTFNAGIHRKAEGDHVIAIQVLKQFQGQDPIGHFLADIDDSTAGAALWFHIAYFQGLKQHQRFFPLP